MRAHVVRISLQSELKSSRERDPRRTLATILFDAVVFGNKND